VYRGRIFIFYHIPSPEAIARNKDYPEYMAGFGLVDLISIVIKSCIDREILARPERIGHNVFVELQVTKFHNEKVITTIGNVARIGNNVLIGQGVAIEHGVIIGDNVVLEDYSSALIDSVIEDGEHLGSEPELSYNARLPKNQKIEPGAIKY